MGKMILIGCITIFAMAICTIIVMSIAALVTELLKFLQAKTAYIEGAHQMLLIKHNERMLNMRERTEITNNLLDFIDEMIENQVKQKINSLIMLNKPYDLKQASDDISMIAKAVYTAFREGVLSNQELLLTHEYISDYIVSTTTTLILRGGQLHNANLHAAEMENR